jgi:hypothetical protein
MDNVFDAKREAEKGPALGEGQLVVETAGLGENEVGVEMGPGFDCSLIATDMGEESAGIGFNGEDAALEEVEGIGCAEEVGLFYHFHDGGLDERVCVARRWKFLIVWDRGEEYI